MPQRALYELAEAALGLAPEMQWSVDEGIARRESARLFERVQSKTTDADTALEVFMIMMMTKLENSRKVIESRYENLLAVLNDAQRDACPTLNEFFEYFTGLSREAVYTTSLDITRTELSPLFQACFNGVLSARDCQDAVMDNASAKQETILQLFQDGVKKLKSEIDQIVSVKEGADGRD